MSIGVIILHSLNDRRCLKASWLELSIITAPGFGFSLLVQVEALKGGLQKMLIVSIVKVTCWARFLSSTYSRSTTLTIEVQHPLGIISIKTVLELHLVINERSQRMVHTTHGR